MPLHAVGHGGEIRVVLVPPPRVGQLSGIFHTGSQRIPLRSRPRCHSRNLSINAPRTDFRLLCLFCSPVRPVPGTIVQMHHLYPSPVLGLTSGGTPHVTKVLATWTSLTSVLTVDRRWPPPLRRATRDGQGLWGWKAVCFGPQATGLDPISVVSPVLVRDGVLGQRPSFDR